MTMWKNETLNDILETVLTRQLGKAADQLENFLLSSQRFQAEREQLAGIRNDYRLMADYWLKGFDDPDRQQVYDRLLRRLYVLVTNVIIRDRLHHNMYLQTLSSQAQLSRRDWSTSLLTADLEGFVTDVALLELEPEHVRKQKSEEVYRRHQLLLDTLFDYICTSGSWPDSLARTFEDILLSPTIDVVDQQLMVSAITLSAMNYFDFNKFRLLTHVYEKTPHEVLRQRALVGWVLSADADKARLYDEMRPLVARLCADERCREELAELQMQLFFCMQADDDTKTIRNEIMPDLMEGSHIRVTKNGIVEQDEDQMEDILHPDASEQTMERMEASMHRMADMQRQGSDIYFAGFSQMKRFPFFSRLASWFVPFYPQYPGISQIWDNSHGRKFLRIIMQHGAFCDSDKYSFVLAFDQILSHLPAQMLQMIDRGEASPMPVGGEVTAEEQHTPAFIRRLYLQNLYRFFRLFSQRSEFVSPFGPQPSPLFFASPLFRGAGLESQMLRVASFLMKRRRMQEAVEVLHGIDESHRDLQYCLMMGHLLLDGNQSSANSHPASFYFRQALQAEPDNLKALRGYARSLFRQQQYSDALAAYQKLLTLQPENRTAQLNAAVCQVSLKQYDEALKQLYKLNYLYPDSDDVTRVLAWTHTVGGKYESAMKLYARLLNAPQPQPSAMLNRGYCLWFSGDVAAASAMFRQFLSHQHDPQFSIEEEFTQTEHSLIAEHGITDAEIQLMLDSLV